MQKPHIAKLARRAIDAGATFELVVIVKRTKKSGSVVRMESRDVLPPRSHGSLIRLNGDDHE